jgi:hypothetical protein
MPSRGAQTPSEVSRGPLCRPSAGAEASTPLFVGAHRSAEHGLKDTDRPVEPERAQNLL